ncbi:MAG: hypothetical protein H7A46_22550 [Verrucomicrobiales bacterium]|nr:hypothetical protein [Verrucomicrobiales bacterium]
MTRSPFLYTALLAGLISSPQAEVIDSFDDGPKWDGMLDPSGIIEVESVDGQARFRRPAPSTSDLTQVWYLRSYAIPEGRTLEFRLDSVSASSDEAATPFFFSVKGAPQSAGYAIHRLGNAFWLGKYKSPYPMSWYHQQTPTAVVTEPVTHIYSFARHGDNVEIRAKAVMRDDPEQVVAELPPVIDTPGRETLYDGGLEAAAAAAPHYGPSMFVVTGMAFLDGNHSPAELTIDNLICSEEPTPTKLDAGLSGDQLQLSWSGTWTVVQADSPGGPWLPAMAGTDGSVGVPDKICRISPTGLARFFRLVPGHGSANSFTDGSTTWRSYAATPGTSHPLLLRAGEGYRITATGIPNQDFLLLDADGQMPWQRDCIASIDLANWDETMAEATFGLLLRVWEEDQVWRGADGLPEDRYEGAVTFRAAGDPAESALTIRGPGGEILAQTEFPLMDPARTYRLRFSAFGDQLDLAIYDAAVVDVPVASCHATDTRLPVGLPGLHGTKSAGDLYELTVTDLLLNGTARSSAPRHGAQ